MTPTLLRLAALSIAASLLPAQTPANAGTEKPNDRQLVLAAGLDYVESIYLAQPERLERSATRDLDKVGALRGEKGYEERPMTFAELHELAAKYNKDGTRIPEDAIKEVEVLDLLPEIAVVKVTATWGIDLMQLIKTGGHWQIKHIVWQRAPKPAADAAADEKAIRTAAEGYALALYEARPQLTDKHVHRQLAKLGIRDGKQIPMTFQQLRDLAATLHKDEPAPADSPRDVEILDLNDNIACVKLTGAWGIDYMNLLRTDNGWQIRQIMWQPHPAEEAAKKAAE